MPATRYQLSDLLATPERMQEVAKRIATGDVGIYPTETIYGLGGRADSLAVKQRLYEVKNRPKSNPFIIIAADRSAFDVLSVWFPFAAKKLAEKFWPGRLTLVIPLKDSSGYIAVRTSDHPLISSLRQYFSLPLFSTSANLSGSKYNGDPDSLFDTFKDSTDFFIDAGPLSPSPPSTVIKIYEDYRIGILREGAIPSSDIERTLEEFPFEIERGDETL